MCTHQTCTPLVHPTQHIEAWVQRAFEMAAAVRRGLLPVAHLNQFTSPAMAKALVHYVVSEPHAIKTKVQWCKAEFLALSSANPPAYVGSLTQRHGELFMVAFQVLPPRRY